MKRIIAVVFVISLIFSIFTCCGFTVSANKDTKNGLAAVFSEDAVFTADVNSTGISGVALAEGDTLKFAVNAESAGRYSVLADYYINEIHGSYLECELYENKNENADNATYRLAASYSLGEVKQDDAKNELTPDWTMDEKWYSGYILSSSAFSVAPIELDLVAGTNEFTLKMTNGNAFIGGIYFVSCDEVITYSQYLEKYKNEPCGDKCKVITVQAEDVFSASSKVVLPFCDSSSVYVTPIAERLQIMNAVGGNAWNIIGQEASWQIDVKTAGWYSIAVRYRQDYTDGRATIRSIFIDGELPFAECEEVAFPYETDWVDNKVSKGDKEYKFYLSEGTHTISLAPALGEMQSILEDVQTSLQALNAAYRKIIMITSSTPDAYRDYLLDEKIPETLNVLKSERKALLKLAEKMPSDTNSSLINRLADQLEEMYKYPDTIAGTLSTFQSNLTALATWINDQKTQPLALDEITFYPAGSDYEKETVGFFGSLYHSIKRFLYSFSSEYVGVGEKDGKTIEVWVTTGRDQMQIIRRMINETFTPVERLDGQKIYVDIRMIDTAALLPAVVSGIGPDVALGEGNSTPVNFASRGAIYDLNSFSDAKSIYERFSDSAIVPFRYENGVYALPETQTFKMMFYRTDIFEEYGWSVPETWEQVKSLIFDLSKNNMQFGFDATFQSYCMMLYQNGGSVYSEHGTRSTLNEREAIESFKQYTQFYKEYKIPVSYNFANRFRSGEMPIAIADYIAYNTLEVFAPEIKGQWDITTVPGKVLEDGTVDHTSIATGVCCFILGDTKYPKESWEFLKWWTEADVQAKYGNQIEDKLGGSARYATANLEALAQIPWSSSFYKELTNQLESVRGIPEVPGGYFTSRHFNNAFRAVVYDAGDAQETLLEYVGIMNDEITKKRKEFGLSTEE